jgi:hypothetical protein
VDRLISLTVVLMFSAIPALALFPGWQHHAGPPVAAPRQSPPPASAPVQHEAQSAPNSNSGYRFQPKGPGPHRGDWLRKYMALPPHQQEQQLQHDPSFKSLSPDRQNHLLDRLRKFNSQSPEQKAKILNRMENFEHMTPEQQQAARSLFDRYHNLPDDQKSKVSQAYRRLRGMPPSARNDLLNSDEFRNNYTDDQRELLRGMTDLNVPPTK